MFKFLAKIGTVGMTAKNASLAYKACVHHGLVPDNWDNLKEKEIHENLLKIFEFSQLNKPQSENIKISILNEFNSDTTGGMIKYVFACLKHESGLECGTSSKMLNDWYDIVIENFDKNNIPDRAITGYISPRYEGTKELIMLDIEYFLCR